MSAPTETVVQPTVFLLIGSPGVGKYTVARELVSLTGARLVDNHAIANVIFNLLDIDGTTLLPPEVFRHVAVVRRAVLDALGTIAPRDLSYVLTMYLRGESQAETALFDEVAAVAEARGSQFIPVLLKCATSELVSRVVSDSRRDRMKLIDPSLAAHFNDAVPPFTTDHTAAITLEITSTPAPAAAQVILDWARSRNMG